MLIVELNIAGYRFSREIPALRRKSFAVLRLGHGPTSGDSRTCASHTLRNGRLVKGQHDHVVSDARPQQARRYPNQDADQRRRGDA